jgi:eukaryotic-like serine/threonine-protein kinase
MPLAPGSRLGPYEITAKLGEGGMGEVYRATDTKLDRQVAIKVLPAEFTEDKERLARFEREAKLLAQLHHPNIASIFGLEESDGTRALVMELVEGPTLAERLEQGPLPFNESLSVSLQIAHALEEAHEKGIVHRDLKPQNIKASIEGKVKVLDFGLAKAMDPAAGSAVSAADLGRSPTLMNSPTLTAVHGTQLGVILGTAAYMAPEQAKGLPIDKRADIWAFGVVLYEMLSGRSLFAGDTVTDTLAGVLKTEIDFAKLPGSTPAAMRRLLRRCLERNPKNRLHDIADARIVLEELTSGKMAETDPASTSSAGTAPRSAAARWLPWALAALASVVAVVLAFVPSRAPRPAPEQTIRFEIATPESDSPTNRGRFFELSPDGRFLLMAENGEIWVRPLDAATARRLEGIDDATYPFWSPDSAWIGFFAGGELRRVARDGGRAQKICAAPDGRGATWSPAGVILFSDRLGNRGLSKVSAQGGAPVAVTQIAAEAVNDAHRYPQFLPDGKSFLFLFLAPSPEVQGVYLGRLDGGAPERVLEGSDQAIYARADRSGSGYLVYRRDSTLLAQPFDLGNGKPNGEAIPVADAVGESANTGSGAFTFSSNGLLAFSDEAAASGELAWFGRSGERGEPLGAVGVARGVITGLSLARGAQRAAFGLGTPPDVHLLSLPDGEPSRFTFGPAPGWSFPIWSPDGSEIVYATLDQAGLPEYEIRRRRVDRNGGDETLLTTKTAPYPWDWSPDGSSLLYGDWAGDLWLLPLTGERTPVAYLAAPGQQAYAQFSPDGRLVAYASDEQGRFEVFVATMPPTGALWQISTGGGSMPRWRRDGRELYFRANDGTLMAVALGAGAGTAAIEERAAPRALFSGIPSPGNSSIFTYTPDDTGQRFLVASTRSSDRSPITVIVNWHAALGRRATNGTP